MAARRAWAIGVLAAAVAAGAPAAASGPVRAKGTAMDEQALIEVERLGGFVGYGPNSRFRARGTLPWQRLPAAERTRLEKLLDGRIPVPAVRGADMFRYRITVRRDGREDSVELPEDVTPAALRDCVKDEPPTR